MSTIEPPPDTVWVQHRGNLHEIDAFCPDLWPFSSILAHRMMAGRSWLDPRPITIVRIVDGTDVTVEGASTREDPLRSAQVADQPLGVCRCDEAADQLQAGAGVDVHGAGARAE